MSDLKSPRKINYSKDELIFDHIHNYNIDYIGNQIFLFADENQHDGESMPGVEFAMSNRFIKNMQILMAKSSEPILIHMHSYGGDWHAGMAIFDTIRHCPNHVVILNYSSAESMTSIILQAADTRVMMPNSYFMFHEGEEGIKGTFKQFKTHAIEAERNIEQMMDIYITSITNSENCKMSTWSTKKIKKWLKDAMDKNEEVYLSSEEAVNKGFADKVFSGDWASLGK